MLAKIGSWFKRFDTAVANTTGTQLLSAPVFLAGLLSSTLLRVLGTPFGSGAPFWQQLIEGWFAYLLLWLWIQTLTRWLIHLGSSARYLVVLSVLVGASGRGALVHFFVRQHDAEPVELLAYRMLSSILLVGIVMLLASYALSAMSRQTARLDQLVAYRKVLSDSLEQVNFQLDEWFSDLVAKVRAKLLSELGRRNAHSPGTFSANLKSLIANVVRPVSAELTTSLPPNPRIQDPVFSAQRNLARMVQASSTLSWRTRPVITPLIIGLLSVPSIAVFGNASIIEVFVGFGLLQATGLLITNFIFQKRPHTWSVFQGALLLQLLVLLANVPPAYYTVWRIGFLETRPDAFHSAALILMVGFSFITLLVATVDATLRGVRQIESELNETVSVLRWHLAKTKGEMWRRQQALARVLHGPVQANLTAHSIRIDLEASAATQRELELTAIDETYRAIESLDEVVLATTDFQPDLEKILSGWKGICEVKFQADAGSLAALNSDVSAARILLDLLQEGLGNAVRHGKASEVLATISLVAEDMILVTLTDNGVGLDPDSRPGVGSHHLDALTTGWTIATRGDGKSGARLNFFVPVAARVEPVRQFTESTFLS